MSFQKSFLHAISILHISCFTFDIFCVFFFKWLLLEGKHIYLTTALSHNRGYAGPEADINSLDDR